MSANGKITKLAICLLAALLVCIAYSNHFNNPFEFDDEHTIVNNTAIRELKNIPTFFKDARTTSTLPKSQAYRPGLTTLNAIDYAIGGQDKPVPFYFHFSIFVSFIVLGICLFYFSKFLFQNYFSNTLSFYASLLVATLFCVHTANTQTINYIISRDDSFSTLMVVVGFLLYFYSPLAKKFYLYLLPMVIGFMVKEPAIMFAPLLTVYKLFFESKYKEQSIFKFKNLIAVFLSSSLAFIMAALLFAFSQSMTPATWTSGNLDRWNYLISQPFVFIHYFNNFFLPFNLVVDTDWEFVTKITDDRFLIGLGFLVALIVIIVKCAKKHPLLSFGLSWFILALLPSSSIIPLAEVLNDHRPFFAYIGLTLSSAYLLMLLYNLYAIKTNLKAVFKIGIVAVLILHSVGTYKQNAIWQTAEGLWKEATLKSPKNGRVWMNYANSLMSRGAYAEAEVAYNSALKVWPEYPYLFINFGILKSVTNRFIEAEMDFKKALNLDSENPEFYFYYGKFLIKQKRFTEAATLVNTGIQKSRMHGGLLSLRNEIELLVGNPDKLLQAKIKEEMDKVKTNPTPENYIELSLAYYNAKQFNECIVACNEALKLKPDYSLAYNNICSSYNELKQWDKAIEAGNKGLLVDPTNELLKGNLNVALQEKKKEK